MATYPAFAEVIDLDLRALHQLLHGDGDDAERLWAAWALALRRAGAAVPALAQATAREPSEGVRAHVALVLVGLGERALALELARRDPSTLVRESAWRHLARTTAHDDATEADALAAALAGDRAPDVRVAILDELPTTTAGVVRERALARIDDPDARVRAAAVDYAARLGDPTVVTRLLERAGIEEGEIAFMRIVTACVRELGEASVVGAAAAWAVPRVLRLLSAVLACTTRLTEEAISPLLVRTDARIHARLVELESAGSLDLSLRALLILAARSGTFDEERLRSRLASRAALDDDESSNASALAARIARAYDEAWPNVPLSAARARREDSTDGDDAWAPGLGLLPELERLTR